MNRLFMGLAVSALLLGMVGRADADLVIVTDQAAFASNDSAPWVRTDGTSASYSTTSGIGTFSWNFTTDSTPFYQSLVSTIDGTLFVGVTSYGTSATASYIVNASFDFGGQPVTGFGFLIGPDTGTQLTVFDVEGSHAFTLDSSANRGFVGIESSVPLTGFQFSESVPSGTATLFVQPVLFQVTPVPSGLNLAFTGAICIGGYAWRRNQYRSC